LPWLLLAGVLAVAVGAGTVAVATSPTSFTAPASPSARAAGHPSLPTLSSPLEPAPTIGGAPAVTGALRAPGGPFLYDRHGRVVVLHGVNVVYKHPPFEVYPDPGKPWNFSAADASLMARLGFNVVRLGMTWGGLEPGTAPANDPAICRRGTPANPHQFDQAVLSRYLRRLRETVDLLGRYHIYTILDMHQDVYNEMFDGEGAPSWAVCTDGVPSVEPPGRWSVESGTAAAGVAGRRVWTNAGVGELQGEYDRVWGDVAEFFRSNRWVLGYDPFNEPFSRSLLRFGDEHFDGQLECFYTGTGDIGEALHGAPAIRCPRHDPAKGVVPTLLADSPGKLVFDEPDNYSSRGYPTFIGPMNFPNLVFNVHVYCGARSPHTGNPTTVVACAAQEARSLARRAEDRPEMASSEQPGGPAWFVSELGATSNAGLLAGIMAQADRRLVGWAYWSWRYYADPTGSAAEALVMADGKVRTTARVLSQTYPEAIAGTPVSMSFDPASAAFDLDYIPDHAIRAPTVIFVPTRVHYPDGYCARVSGGVVHSRPRSDLLVVANASAGHAVRVSVAAGPCRG
jgi:endoglycosylceramidase